MKKFFVLAVALVCVAMIMTTAGFRNIPGLIGRDVSRKCAGYTIIAFDKGIDCHGDTIRLVRRNGYAEKAGVRR